MMHIHFIGICGTFMAGLARIASELGHTVTGSDKAFYPPMSDQLKELGVKAYTGYNADIWDEITPDLVIVGNVCTRGMPIIESMLERKIAYTSGPKWLSDEVLTKRKVIAIAGTHGKTTTTSMLIHILFKNGLNPGYLVGGVASDLAHSSALGSDDVFVIEADEYDSAYFDKRPKFIHYYPHIFVVGNIEFDHADIYNNIDEIERQFHYGVRMVSPQGTIVWGSGESIDRVKEKGVWSKSFDQNSAPFYQLGNQIDIDGEKLEIPATIVGEHNQKNAYHAMLCAKVLGLPVKHSIDALKSFSGVKRRLELIYSNLEKNIFVYEDFAHHPTAIEYTLNALKQKHIKSKIIAAFEPRSNTMKMGVFTDQFARVFQNADEVYALSEKHLDCRLSQLKQFNHIDLLLEQLVPCVCENSVLVLMSNGDFSDIYQKIIQKLEAKY